MIIEIEKEYEKTIKEIQEMVLSKNCHPDVLYGDLYTVIAVEGDASQIDSNLVETFPGVVRTWRISSPYKTIAKKVIGDQHHKVERERLKIAVPGPDGFTRIISDDKPVFMAGPCAVESRECLMEVAQCVKEAGATVLRAGAFKPRTSPYAFQGMGVKGLAILVEAREKFGLHIVTEVMDTRDVEMVAEMCDIIQIGARNMQNFNLLKVVGRTDKPVMIKRGLSSTVQELLMSAEYVMSQGNHKVILCERGIRTFEPMTRNTLDLSAVPVLNRESHLPVMVDPSHGTGHWDLVKPMACASVAAGADGVIVEVHPRPEEAFSDGSQSLLPKTFRSMMEQMRAIAGAVGKTI